MYFCTIKASKLSTKLSLRIVPRRLLADELLRPGGEEHLILELELAVDEVDEFQRLLDLRLHVLGAAEDVPIVLLEPPHAREACDVLCVSLCTFVLVKQVN